jgi:hypothetical protein
VGFYVVYLYASKKKHVVLPPQNSLVYDLSLSFPIEKSMLQKEFVKRQIEAAHLTSLMISRCLSLKEWEASSISKSEGSRLIAQLTHSSAAR